MAETARTLFVPFAPPGTAWVVRKPQTVVASFDSRDDALAGARQLAREIFKGKAEVVIQAQDEDGQWHALPLDDSVASS